MTMNYFTYIVLGLVLTLQSCENYLDVKPRSNLVIPETLDDMEQLLDNGTVFAPYPEMLELQADTYYLEETYWSSMFNQVNKSTYTWERDIFGTDEGHEAWSTPYHKIFYTNAVLDGLEHIERTAANAARYDQIKGAALFLKAEAVYILAQLFAKVYDVRTANEDLGVPVPMSADVNEKVYRPTLQYTFDFITTGLLEAEKLLSDNVDFSRPSKAATHALLARVYLYMGQYDKALLHSDASLRVFDDMIDLNKQTLRDFKQTLLFRYLSPTAQIRNASPSTFIDRELIASYDPDDKRLTAFFSVNNAGKIVKRNTHNLALYCFGGFDADEQYLIRAECLARKGDAAAALEDLNHLLKHRIGEVVFEDRNSEDQTQILEWILEERRKELIFRGVRWSDLKRLNRDGYNISLTRTLGDDTYSLAPGDPRWVLPIPRNEISSNGLTQNER